ncbi:MAG: serine protease [Pseudomonadota bacterium]
MRNPVEFTRTKRSSIARVWSNRHPLQVGAGFVIDKSQGVILTCAHVVAQAMGDINLCFEGVDALPKEALKLDFPMIAQREFVEAAVIGWSPRVDAKGFAADEQGNNLLNQSDIAILQVLEAPAVLRKTRPVIFARERDSIESEKCHAMGWQADVSRGNSINCSVGGPVVGGTQLVPEEQRDEFIEQGFSGGPIWSNSRGLLIGMTHSVHSALDRTAYFIGSAHLRAFLDRSTAFHAAKATYRVEHEPVHDHLLINREEELNTVQTFLQNANSESPAFILVSDHSAKKPDYLGQRIARQTIRVNQGDRPEYCSHVLVDLNHRRDANADDAIQSVKSRIQDAVVARSAETVDIVTKLNERGKPCIYLTKLRSVPDDLSLIERWIGFWNEACQMGLNPLVYVIICVTLSRGGHQDDIEPLSTLIAERALGNKLTVTGLGTIDFDQAMDWVTMLRRDERISEGDAMDLEWDIEALFDDHEEVELHEFIRLVARPNTSQQREQTKRM